MVNMHVGHGCRTLEVLDVQLTEDSGPALHGLLVNRAPNCAEHGSRVLTQQGRLGTPLPRLLLRRRRGLLQNALPPQQLLKPPQVAALRRSAQLDRTRPWDIRWCERV